jgi:hypothetical protein
VSSPVWPPGTRGRPPGRPRRLALEIARPPSPQRHPQRGRALGGEPRRARGEGAGAARAAGQGVRVPGPVSARGPAAAPPPEVALPLE